MNTAVPSRYRDRSSILMLIGILLLLVGVVCAALGPVELYCFYLFSEGGRFHYDGFGFGSFMFAFIALQIMGYYVLAMVCIPLGYAHLKPRRWARAIGLAGVGLWFVVGIPLLVVFMAILVTSKDPSPRAILSTVPLLVLAYPVLPSALAWFYRSRDVRLTFEHDDPSPHWTDQMPVPILTLCMLYIFWIIALHIAIVLSGTFPIFGILLSELHGILLIDASILILAGLTWGTFKQQSWAWWGAVVWFAGMALSVIWTFSRLSWRDLLGTMKFAPTEMEALKGVPASGVHIAAFVGLPLLATLGVILRSKRCFGTVRQMPDSGGRPVTKTEGGMT